VSTSTYKGLTILSESEHGRVIGDYHAAQVQRNFETLADWHETDTNRTAIFCNRPTVRSHYKRMWAQHDFPDTTGISTSTAGTWYAGCNVSEEATLFRIGSGAVRFRSAGRNHRLYNAEQWSTFDASGGFEVEVSFYTSALSATATVWLGLLSGGSVNNYWGNKIVGDAAFRKAGWKRFTFSTSSSTAGGWNSGDVQGWEMRLENFGGGEYIILDQIKVLKPVTGAKATVIFRSDDANDDVLSMAAYAEKYGYYFLIAVNGSFIGLADKCTLAQLQDLSDRGHLICNHTWSHQDWTTLSVAQCVEEFKQNYEYLCENGFARGAGVLVSPYYWDAPAGFEAEVMHKCLSFADVMLTTGRNQAGYPVPGNFTSQPYVQDPHDVRILGLATSDASATASYIENTVAARNGPHVLLYHHLDAGGITTTNFRLAVDKAAELNAAGTIQVMSLEEYLNYAMRVEP